MLAAVAVESAVIAAATQKPSNNHHILASFRFVLGYYTVLVKFRHFALSFEVLDLVALASFACCSPGCEIAVF